MFEHQSATGRGDPVRGDPGRPAPPPEAWGWYLVQRDWSLRQREAARRGTSRLARLIARVEAAIARLWRLIRGAPRHGAQDTAHQASPSHHEFDAPSSGRLRV